MRRSLSLLAFALVSCGTTSTQPKPKPKPAESYLTRFADAMRFMPAGMQSHWFSDHRKLVAPLAAAFLRVQCARNFQAPRGNGVGAYEGVTIEDHVAAPIPAARRAELGELRPSIMGAETRWRSGTPGGGVNGWETWGAIVDERFVVTATSEALLRQALARNGRPGFGKLEPLPEVDPSTIDLVLRDLAGTKPVDAPVPPNVQGVSAVAALLPRPVRVQIWARDARELEAIQGLFQPLPFQPLRDASEATRRAQPADLRFLELEPSPGVDQPLGQAEFHLAMFFGRCVRG
ncbi:MAG TPA: hypothetical protein VF384_06485 [Planctomycetota bacterium]